MVEGAVYELGDGTYDVDAHVLGVVAREGFEPSTSGL